MSLTRTYRSQLALRQSRRLLGYFALAVALHGGAWLLGSRVWQKAQSQQVPQELTSIEFVYVDPQNAAPAPAHATQRRAQVTAAASKTQEDRPIQATQSRGASVLPSGSTVVSPMDASSVLPVSAPPPTRPSSASSPPSRVSLGSSAVLKNLPRASDSTQSRSVPESSPPLSPEVPTPEQSSGAAQLGGPLAVVAGQRGQLNAEQAAAGASVDAVADRLWGTYMDTVNQQVDQHWQRLSVTQTRRAKIRFRIDRQGRLSDVELLESSGDPLTDQAAIQAIQDAAPFAPLPQDAAEEILIVNFTFTYHGVEALP